MIPPPPPSTAVRLRPRSLLDRAEVADLDARFTRMEPAAAATAAIDWAVERFGARLVLTASFADTLLVDLAVRRAPDLEVVFLDTGFHFAETLDTVRRAMARYALELTVLRPAADAADLWAEGTEACCHDRKVAPLERYLVDHVDAWLSGLRRADSATRATTPIVEVDRRGLVKVNPIATWSGDDVARYVADHDVIVNPLAERGYPSIGCWPCTEPAGPAEGHGRAGRWAGTEKTECGLHR